MCAMEVNVIAYRTKILIGFVLVLEITFFSTKYQYRSLRALIYKLELAHIYY